jgi:hypothetical protein
MNWGKGIIIGMGLFMLFIILMCVKMFALPADEYDHHYYEKGLSFDKDYAKERQVIKDNARPVIYINGRQVKITFSAPANGSVRFIRPSSEALDKIFQLNTDTGNVAEIPVPALVKGRWQMVLEWKSAKKSYLFEQEADLQ